mgnify:CR=1 FL=1
MSTILSIDRAIIKVVVSPGKYWIGDNCYFLDSADSDAQNRSFFDGVQGSSNIKVGTLASGIQVVGMQTKYGDGAYYDQFGRMYYVDSGIISLTPFEAYPDYKPDTGDGVCVTFGAEAECTWENGILKFGSVWIDTDN